MNVVSVIAKTAHSSSPVDFQPWSAEITCYSPALGFMQSTYDSKHCEDPLKEYVVSFQHKPLMDPHLCCLQICTFVFTYILADLMAQKFL